MRFNFFLGKVQVVKTPTGFKLMVYRLKASLLPATLNCYWSIVLFRERNCLLNYTWYYCFLSINRRHNMETTHYSWRRDINVNISRTTDIFKQMLYLFTMNVSLAWVGNINREINQIPVRRNLHKLHKHILFPWHWVISFSTAKNKVEFHLSLSLR